MGFGSVLYVKDHLACFGELDGIAHQVGEDLPQAERVTHKGGWHFGLTSERSSRPFSPARGARNSIMWANQSAGTSVDGQFRSCFQSLGAQRYAHKLPGKAARF